MLCAYSRELTQSSSLCTRTKPCVSQWPTSTVPCRRRYARRRDNHIWWSVSLSLPSWMRLANDSVRDRPREEAPLAALSERSRPRLEAGRTRSRPRNTSSRGRGLLAELADARRASKPAALPLAPREPFPADEDLALAAFPRRGAGTSVHPGPTGSSASHSTSSSAQRAGGIA